MPCGMSILFEADRETTMSLSLPLPALMLTVIMLPNPGIEPPGTDDEAVQRFGRCLIG
jgi:hypothetical protein